MNIFAKLFGTEKVVDGAMRGVDALVFTDEEKSNAKLALLKAYEPFKIAQRLLALTFGIPYALAWLITFLASFWVDNVDAQKELLSGDMGTVVLFIVGFYFAGGAAESIFRRGK